MNYIRELNSHFKSFNRSVRLFLMANVLAQIGFGMFMILYNLYVRALGYTEEVNGQIISLTSLASALILIPAGLLSDRIGRKRVLVWATLLAGLLYFGRSVAESQAYLLWLGFIGGAVGAFVQVSVAPFLAEYSEADQRVHLFTLNFSLLMASNVIGNVAGGFIADGLANLTGSEVLGLRWTMYIASFFTLLSVWPLFFIEDRRMKRDLKLTFRSILKEQRSQLKLIGQFTLASAFIGFGAGLVIPYLNLYFHDRFHASNSAIGLVISLGQAATALAILIGPVIVKRFGEVKAVVFLQMISIPFLLLTGFTNSLLLASIGYLFRQAFMNAGNPIQQSLMMTRVNNEMKGLANSIGQMVFMLGWALMGPVSTAIVSRGGIYWGYAIVFTLTALLYFSGSFYFYLTFGKRIKRPAAMENRLPM